jgi:hypothetical protein
MDQPVRLVIPAAPAPVQSNAAHAQQRRISEKDIRLGVLDNSKGNADHQLAMIVEAVRKAVPIASVALTRKPYYRWRRRRRFWISPHRRPMWPYSEEVTVDRPMCFRSTVLPPGIRPADAFRVTRDVGMDSPCRGSHFSSW